MTPKPFTRKTSALRAFVGSRVVVGDCTAFILLVLSSLGNRPKRPTKAKPSGRAYTPFLAGRIAHSGAGGQLDFVLGAYLSKGGKSFICCSSTMKDKAGNLHSRIRPTLQTGSIVTDTRTNVHFLVTEYGMVNLKGASTWERAERIISVAHPDFRDSLIRSAEEMGIWKKSNKMVL